MPLNEQHQLLLQGEVDGHLTDDDRRAAAQLLADPALGAEAAAYVAGLRALRVLLQKHGQVKASPLLASRVLAALEDNFDDVSRPVQNQAGARVHKLPVVRLNTMLMAAAAALVVCVGLIFGPGLWQTKPSTSTIADTPAGGARDVADGTVESAASPETRNPPAPETPGEHPKVLQPPKPEDQTPLNGDTQPPQGSTPGLGTGGGGKGGDKGGKHPGHGDEGGALYDDKTGEDPRVNGSALNRREPVGRGKGAVRNSQGIYVLRLDRGKDQPFELGFEANRERMVSNVQLSADLLSVAALHGEARLLDAATGAQSSATESEPGNEAARDFTQNSMIEVTVTEDALVGLLSALSRYGSTQDFGSLHVPDDLQFATRQESADIQRIATLLERGRDAGNEFGKSRLTEYLPRAAQLSELERLSRLGDLDLSKLEDANLRERLARELADDRADTENDGGPGKRPLAEPRPARNIRLVIRLQ